MFFFEVPIVADCLKKLSDVLTAEIDNEVLKEREVDKMKYKVDNKDYWLTTTRSLKWTNDGKTTPEEYVRLCLGGGARLVRIGGLPYEPEANKFELKDVWFNRKKGLTKVTWTDGATTTIQLQKGDTWNEEKAIALCYMKRMCGNDSSYNNILRANGCFK